MKCTLNVVGQILGPENINSRLTSSTKQLCPKSKHNWASILKVIFRLPQSSQRSLWACLELDCCLYELQVQYIVKDWVKLYIFSKSWTWFTTKSLSTEDYDTRKVFQLLFCCWLKPNYYMDVNPNCVVGCDNQSWEEYSTPAISCEN